MAKDTLIPLKHCYTPTQSRKKVATMKKNPNLPKQEDVSYNLKRTQIYDKCFKSLFPDLTLLTCLSSHFPGLPDFHPYSQPTEKMFIHLLVRESDCCSPGIFSFSHFLSGNYGSVFEWYMWSEISSEFQKGFI